MKTKTQISLTFLLATFILGNFSCVNSGSETMIFTANKPVYMSYEDFRATAVKQAEMQEMENTGKMYFYNNYIFINEIAKGVHIIDNSDPSNPRNIKFIEIPGNVDIVIRNNYLFADSYIDMVVLNISDLENISFVKRIENVFPYQVPVFDLNYPTANIDENEGLVVGWTVGEIEESSTYTSWVGGIYGARYDESTSQNEAVMDGNSSDGGSSGVSGSTARFVLYGDMLYLLDQSVLNAYDISVPTNPVFKSTTNTWRVSETLFVHEDKLFSGTQTGMVVYSLSNPANPTEIASLEHMTSCDPVVVEGDYAYVTLRAGRTCGGGTNRLDVIDISNLNNLENIGRYDLDGPYGLGIRNNKLFVCDGVAGLKVYDASNPLTVGDNMTQHFGGINAFDVIPFENTLLMIGKDGLYQYRYTAGEPLILLSILSVGN